MPKRTTRTKPQKPATVSAPTAGRLFGLGREAAYDRAQEGEIVPGVPVLKVGGRYRVPTAAIEKVLGELDPELLLDAS